MVRRMSTRFLSDWCSESMQCKTRIKTILGIAIAILIHCEMASLAVDPLRVILLSVHEPELNPDWGTEGKFPSLQYTPERFLSNDNESVLIALEACQRARLRGFVVPGDWIEACRQRLNKGENFSRLRGELIYFLLAANDPKDADLLWKVSQDDFSTRLAVEERMIEWQSSLPLNTWRNRLKEQVTEKESLLVAAKGIAELGDSSDLPALEGMLRNRKQPLGIRYAAAQGISRIDAKKALELLDDVAAGKIQGNISLSNDTAAAGPVWDYWLAVSYLVGTHESDRTRDLLIEALKKGSDVARAVALRQLAKMSPDEFKNQLELVRNDPEVNVRMEVLNFMTNHVDEKAIVILGEYLGDNQPRVRELARDRLLKIADNETNRPIVEREVSKAIKSEKWWQIEQAIIAATSLQMRNEQHQLLVLLEHPQPEVYVTAAWGLRVLADSPEVIAKMVEFVKVETDRIFDGPNLDEPLYHRVAHVIEGLSLRKVPESRATIERYVPKNQTVGLVSRMGALWGMGKYLEGKPEPKLSEQYITIIYDKFGFGAEFVVMRYCAMIGLGNFADPATKEKIIALDESEGTPMDVAKKWALEQIEKREKELKE